MNDLSKRQLKVDDPSLESPLTIDSSGVLGSDPARIVRRVGGGTQMMYDITQDDKRRIAWHNRAQGTAEWTR